MNDEPLMMVRVTRDFEAPPEDVFDAWLDPQKARRFLFATPEGEMAEVEINPRAEGKFRIVERRGGEDVEHVGEYVIIDRPRRLGFRFAVPKYASQTTRVTIDIVPRGAGCEVTLTHLSVPAEYAERTQAGWAGMLDALAAAL